MRYPQRSHHRWPQRIGALLIVVLLGAVLAAPGRAAQATTCAGYDSQIWAQSVFETDPARYAALDPDGDGVACADLPPGAAPALWTTQTPVGSEPAELVRVIDGDTIVAMVGGQEEHVRLILIDAPETHNPDNPPECYGAEATDYLTWLLSLGGRLSLEPDVTNRDRFDRLLRYAWLDFGDGEVYFVNEAVVRAGYAALYTYPPDVKYVDQIRQAGSFARDHGYGLWSGCATDADSDTNELTGAQGGAADALAPALAAPPSSAAAPVAAAGIASGCDPSYPDVCIPSPPPDLDCRDVSARRFTVVPPDPHRFDGDHDGIGCESG
jgi:micrococcal nuclease